MTTQSRSFQLETKSIVAILCTWPLRLLSLTALGIWILTFACTWSDTQRETGEFILVFSIPASYFALSAYLTFRPPRMKLLFVIGLLVNAPVLYVAVMSYINYPRAWLGQVLLVMCVICSTFLLAWGLFLVARFTARTHVAPPHVTSPLSEPDHHCLGSRFLEWHEHAAR
jgi:hypothetical protein